MDLEVQYIVLQYIKSLLSLLIVLHCCIIFEVLIIIITLQYICTVT